MLPVESIYTFCLASGLLALAPGPDNLYVLIQSVVHGRQSGIFVTMGLCTGLVVHTTAVALGVAALFKTSAMAFMALKMAGALYLLYLAWQAFSSAGTILDKAGVENRSGLHLYRRGIIMNVTNPKVSIFFLAFLPQFAVPENGPVAQQIFVLGALFILVTFIVFCSIALMAGTLGGWLNKSPGIQLYLNRAMGVFFAGLAVKLVMTDRSV